VDFQPYFVHHRVNFSAGRRWVVKVIEDPITASWAVELYLGFSLVLYYAAALPVVIIHSGWAAVDPYLRGHLFDGFGCAALLTVAWSQLTRPMPVRLRPAQVRVAAAQFFLPLASAAIAAAAAYVANGSWAAVLLVFCMACIFAVQFWNLVVGIAGYDEINKETSGRQNAQSLRNSGFVSRHRLCETASGFSPSPSATRSPSSSAAPDKGNRRALIPPIGR
jgi:hypothetical protein